MTNTSSFNQKNSKAWSKIKEAWDQNPMGVAIVVTAVFTATAKLIDSVGSYQSKKAYAEEARNRSRR
jgi:hypothetical protein